MRSYGMRSAPCTSSASAPRPLPRTIATVGRCLVSAPIAETAAFASRVISLASSSHARFFQDLLSQQIEERPRVSGSHELRHGLRLAHLDAIRGAQVVLDLSVDREARRLVLHFERDALTGFEDEGVREREMRRD